MKYTTGPYRHFRTLFLRCIVSLLLMLTALGSPFLVTETTVELAPTWLKPAIPSISKYAEQLLPQPKVAHAAPSLLLSVRATPESAAPGDTVVFTIRYRCASLTEHCLNTIIDHTLPSGMDVVSYSASGGLIGSASRSGQTATWNLQSPSSPTGQLDAGSTGMVRVVGRWQDCGTAVTAGTYTATTNINSTGSSNSTNTSVTLETDIAGSCPTSPPETVDLVKTASSGSQVVIGGVHNIPYDRAQCFSRLHTD